MLLSIVEELLRFNGPAGAAISRYEDCSVSMSPLEVYLDFSPFSRSFYVVAIDTSKQ